MTSLKIIGNVMEVRTQNGCSDEHILEPFIAKVSPCILGTNGGDVMDAMFNECVNGSQIQGLSKRNVVASIIHPLE